MRVASFCPILLRVRLALSCLVALGLSGLSGCDKDTAFFIYQNQVPLDGCLISAESELHLPQGLLGPGADSLACTGKPLLTQKCRSRIDNYRLEVQLSSQSNQMFGNVDGTDGEVAIPPNPGQPGLTTRDPIRPRDEDGEISNTKEWQP